MLDKRVFAAVAFGLLLYWDVLVGLAVMIIILIVQTIDVVAYLPGTVRRFLQRDCRNFTLALLRSQTCLHDGLQYRFSGRLEDEPRSLRDPRVIAGSWKVALHTFYASTRDRPICDIFESTSKQYADKTMFVYPGRNWTFREIDNYANQVAQYFSSVERLEKRDCVALVASNCPQYIAIWLGLNRLGCVTALINTNLTDEALRHAVIVAEAKIVICHIDLWKNFGTVKDKMPEIRRSFVFTEEKPVDGSAGIPDDVVWFDEAISKMPTDKPVVDASQKAHYLDKVVYIYTSGTTGLPKPCVVTSHRAFVYAIAHHYILGVRTSDVLYCVLPFYHSAAGAISVGQALVFGTTIVLRKTFSASRFWDDVINHNCTVFHYVGELCRYLLAQRPNPKESQHSIRLMYGVGLRPQIWEAFVERFRIPEIREVYGSTEGNAAFANLDGRVGAIGFTSFLIEKFKGQYFIKVDVVSGEPLRGASGLCICCRPNEPGELVGRITTGKFSSFDGYLQKEATQKKYLRDVLAKGDLFFRTGDILMYDNEGYVHFVDRTGDTFRWKGENVSTTEVEGIISRITGDVDVAVFGVLVPGCEGRAGMACIGREDTGVDIDLLNQQVKEKLAGYARPLFLRFLKELQVTGSFKIMKNTLKDEGYDIKRVGDDHLYYWHTGDARYQRLNEEAYAKITEGAMRF